MIGPDGNVEHLTANPPLDSDMGFSLEYGPLEKIGAYAVRTGERQAVYVANIDPSESDLRACDEESLRAALNCKFDFVDAATPAPLAGGSGRTTEVGLLGLYAVLALLVIEAYAAMKFGSSR